MRYQKEDIDIANIIVILNSYFIDKFLNNMFKKFILFLMLIKFNFIQAQSPYFSCSTNKNSLDDGLQECWQQLQKNWHIHSHNYPKDLLKSAIIDYSYQNQNISIRFNKQYLMNELLKKDISFTGELSLLLLLIHVEHKVISANQDKFIIDIGKALIEKCAWSTITPNFDLSEIFLKGSHLHPPLSTQLLDLPKKYKAFGYIALEMDSEHNMNLYFIGPSHPHTLISSSLTTTSSLKNWLDTLIPESFYLTKDTLRSTLSFAKPYWSYSKIVTLLENQAEVENFQLVEITPESITMYIDSHFRPQRVLHWASYYPDLSVIQHL